MGWLPTVLWTLHPATGKVIPGAVDWNDEHPWTSEQGNEWDTVGDGGQCKIQPWTRPYYDGAQSRFTYTIRKEYASVAYTEVGRDTPYDFNADLLEQIKAIRYYGNLPGHKTTLAPTKNDWQTYIDHTKGYSVSDLIISDNTLSKDTVYTAKNSVTINPGFDSNGYDLIVETTNTSYKGNKVNQEICHPYRPVFSSIVLHGAASFHNINWGITYQDAAGFSAGVNCNGLTQQAASYQGNNYVYENLGERLKWSFNYGGAYPVNEGDVDRVWYLREEDNKAPYDGKGCQNTYTSNVILQLFLTFS